MKIFKVRELALSMDFDLGKFSMSQTERDSIESATASDSSANKQNDSYDSILTNIDSLLKK